LYKSNIMLFFGSSSNVSRLIIPGDFISADPNCC
jgi:hypothetical protein